MMPEAGKRQPRADMLKRFADVAPFYEVTLTGDDELRFVCARCRQVFSYPASGRAPGHRADLAAHLSLHGVGPSTLRPVRRKPGDRHRGGYALPGVQLALTPGADGTE